MDEILRKIVTESESLKLTPIVSQSHQAIEIFCDKSSLIRLPINEVRDKCFKVFHLCLSNTSKTNKKLIQLSINGMQLMVRQQIYWTVNCKADEQQLPSQLIECISTTISVQKESTQLELLSIITEMSCSIPSLISIDNIEDIIEMCCKLSSQSANHQMAIEATASQSCHQFIKYCISGHESSTGSSDESANELNNNLLEEEVIPLFNLLTNKLKLYENNCNSIGVLLKCIHYIFITILNDSPIINEVIVDIIWKYLIPVLIKQLSASDLTQISLKGHESSSSSSSIAQQSSDGKQHMGRGSESITKHRNTNTNSYKTYIFKIASELLRLFGRISSLRPALESLFHRILLYPPVPQRLDALKWIQELLKNTSLIVTASIEPFECFGKSSRSKDLDLLHIIMDSLEECSLSTDPQISSLSITSIVVFLHSLQSISNTTTNELNADIIEHINRLYPTLADAEFEGFDVRTLKSIPQIQSTTRDSYFENQTKVSFEILKKRIVGFDAKVDMTTDTCEEVVEDKSGQSGSTAKDQRPESIDKELRNFRVESYKSKLREILCSKSTDSTDNTEDSQDMDEEQSKDNCVESETSDEIIDGNNGTIETTKALTKMESLSTNYEEVDEYQNSFTPNTSCTEGPEYEDCADADHVSNSQLSGELLVNSCVPQTTSDCVHQERNNSRRFINSLKIFLPKLLSFRTSVEADQALQLFASSYCTDLFEQQKHSLNSTNDTSDLDSSSLTHLTIINADGIYLSTYSALLLNLKLIHSNFYTNSCLTIPLTEQEFIDDIHNSGILVYISSYWLAELYQRVLSDNLLESAGYKHCEQSNVALINLLTDMDGLDSCQPGAQQLSDYRRLEKAVNTSHIIQESLPESTAANKLVRRLLTAFWDTILGCLGTVFRADCNTSELNNTIALNVLLGADSKTMSAKKDMITSSLDGLQIAAKLCIQLGLQSRCDTVFELLALSVIEDKDNVVNGQTINKKTTKQIRRSVIEVIRNRLPFSLHTSHVLSLQVLLSCSLEIGSHCTPCWRYVFKCCQYIMELEHNYFTSRHSSLLTSTRTSLSSLIKSATNKQSDIYMNFGTNIMDTTSMPGINECEEINTETCINNLIAETTSQTNDCILKDKQLERVIDILSHLVDLLFEDAANKLNLRSLNSFLTELCLCSRDQLSIHSKTESGNTASTGHSGKSLLLFRLSDVILRFAKSGRPVLHFMKCWSVVATHLVEAATHCDPSVAKKSISTLHDIINVHLSLHNELPHFHFNEALFKPFENLLLLELCDSDVQELIISSICEFVEGTTEEIRSGWRTLFGALRGIRLPQVSPLSANSCELESERRRQLRVILDIFEAFLHTDNLQVFANAAVDCLLCLLKLIKSPQTVVNDSEIEFDGTESPDLCLISLKYLHQFQSMLRSMYQMPACPMFSSNAKRLHTYPATKLIDVSQLSVTEIELKIEVTLEKLDRPQKILHVWFLLVDELTQAIEQCDQKHKRTAIEMLFQWFNSLIEIPGPNFAIYCTNHILLPSIQRMTRQTLDNPIDNASAKQISLTTVRHLYGLTADLIVNLILLLNYDSNGCDLSESQLYGIELMLKQSLLVYIECFDGKYNESVAKLSCACIRHILLSVRTHFDRNLWQTTIDCLSIGHRITLESLQTLVNVFNNKSQQFFDDLDQIQVISRRDPNEDSEQLCRLAQQIFLLEAQRGSVETANKWRNTSSDSIKSCTNVLSIGENRSFVFLITNGDNSPLTVSFRSLIIQLTCHWLIIQTLSSLLLIGIKPLMPHIEKLVDNSDPESKPTIQSLDRNQCKSLLSLLDNTYRIAFDFDSKPGLKFLIQKISHSEVPTNLYQFSSLVWSVEFAINLYLSCDELSQNTDNNEFSLGLKLLLNDLCERYTQHMKAMDENEVTIDDICRQSLYFLQTSNEELMNIISNNKTPIERTDERVVEQNEESIQHSNREPSVGTNNLNNDSNEELVDNCVESDVKVYGLATETKIESLRAEYKRYKTQLSPIPPTIGTESHCPSKKSLNDRPVVSNETKDSEKFVIKDRQAFTHLWSDVFSSAIDLHLSQPIEAFNYLIPLFVPSIQSLTLYSDNKHLRSRICQWISRIAENTVNKSIQ